MSVLAIVHPSNLLGKELRETLGRGVTGPTWQEVRLLTTHEQEIGVLTDAGGAAAVVQRYEPETLDGVSVAFFCGPIAANRPALAELPPEVTAVVLSPDATLADGHPVVAGINSRPGGAANGGPSVLLSPHPAVVLLAHLLYPLAAFEPRQAVATVVLPVSLQDEPGLEELFEQTRQIIAMAPRRRSQVFGAQIAFNLLPAGLAEETAATVATALGAVLPAPVPLAIQLVQGGIFHCLALALHVSSVAAPSVQAVRKALTASPFVEPAGDPRHLGPIDAAASDKVLLGAIRRDEHGVSIWAAMDNLTRGGALNALEIAAAVH
ncbi:MAG TPA: Asd/ArgC dimerization domain-containing protein [Thermoanaerobaculia bacterium]|nr:Asd/ArgC dimerization domain-containing protein [Thermoanaerobaculia bacterium]